MRNNNHSAPIKIIINISLLLCSLTAICSAQQPVDTSTDESSLLSIKSYITSDPNDVISTNWSQGTSFCTWRGVTCSSSTQRVTSLDLFDFELTGTISPQIGNLSFLTYLDIRNNSFTGTIPDTIGNLAGLRELKMGANQLNGNVPSSLGMLKSLEVLDLWYNNLRGNVPWGIIFNSTSLQEVDLSMNQNLSGHLPLDIGDMSQLVMLSLGRNQFTGTIPPSIGNLTNLGMLDLSSNSFEGVVPSEIGHLSNLVFLSLEVNRLNGELPPSIFNLTTLETLSLRMNNLSGTIPSSIDTGLPNIQVMYLTWNRFYGEIPKTIGNLSQLTLFSISDNSFGGLMPTNLGNLHQLQAFRVGRNMFSNNLSIPQQDFLTSLTNCRNLTYFNIGNTSITGALPISVGNFSTSLRGFLAGDSRLTGTIPSEIGNITSLIWLHLRNNHFNGEIPTALGSLRNMQNLILTMNDLRGPLPESICQLKNLYRVDFEGNRLSGQLPACVGNISSLEELHLSRNLFDLTIPSSIWYNTRLQILSLSGNRFHGPLPSEIIIADSLRELSLDGNQLSGNIPLAIGELQSLTTLQLQNNRFDGSIPQSLSYLHALRCLDLSQNNLSGSIPKSFENLADLDYFNVSFNNLAGEIPDGGRFVNFTADVFLGNRDLCGESRFRVRACDTNRHDPSSNNHKLVLHVIAATASVLVVAVVILWFLRHRVTKLSASSPSDSNLDDFSHQRVSYRDILRATNDLHDGNLIGKGSIGSVYKGLFYNEMAVAVKVFNLDVQGAFNSFDTECKILRSLRHRNLVKIITSCSNNEFKALVMECMPNGNLDKWLYSPNCGLSIDHRLQIMIDVASAVEYLHHGYFFTIVHCDLKPSNILLDEDMVAHVGDFGIAKILTQDQRMEQTKTFGTTGYMAPEYGTSGLVSTMADVYSFGILLIETFTRKRPTHELFLGELTITKWVRRSFPHNVMQIVDAELLKTKGECCGPNTEECLRLIMELALQCSTDLPRERPNMNQVLVRLKKIKFKLQYTEY